MLLKESQWRSLGNTIAAHVGGIVLVHILDVCDGRIDVEQSQQPAAITVRPSVRPSLECITITSKKVAKVIRM